MSTKTSKSEYARVALFILTMYILSEFSGWYKLIAAIALFVIVIVLRKFLPKIVNAEIGKV